MAITRLGPNQDITAAKIAGQINFKNLIINGDMSIAQRGTSSTGQTSAGYKSLDRYRFNIDGLGTWTISQDSDVPSGQGFGYSQKIACTTADASPAAGDVMQMQYKIEGQMLQYLKKGTSSAESLTLSFWVRSNKTGTYVAELYDMDNTRSISKSYTINSADTWEKKTLTYAGDTTGSFTNDNNLSLQLYIWLASGTRYTSGTLNTSWGSITDANRASGQVNLGDSSSNTFYITGIQLEAGTSASDFEFLPYDVNLQRCYRYYQRFTGGSLDLAFIGACSHYATGNAYGALHYYPKRSAPTLGYSNLSGLSYFSNGANASPTLIQINQGNTLCAEVRIDQSSVQSAGGNGWMRIVGTSEYVDLSSEL